MLTFNFRMTTPSSAIAFNVGDDMTILRLEGVSVTGNPMFLALVARFSGGSVWTPFIINDNGEQVITNTNFMTSSWYLFGALGNSNSNNQQMGRLITNINSNVNKVFLNLAENWDFTNSVLLKYFAVDTVAPFYFSGSIGRIDYIGGAYSTSAGTSTSDNVLEWHMPYVQIWLDMTDPEVTQLFQNRMTNEYGSTINGFTNHSDYQDLQFNFKQGWIFRKNVQQIIFPTIKYYPDLDINFVYIIKYKIRKVNQWNQGGEWLRVFEYTTGASSYYTRAHLFKYDYASPVRIRLDYPGQGAWDMCSYTISPANELGESVESALSMHVFRPPYYRQSSDHKQSCTLSTVSGVRRTSVGYSSM